MTDHTRLLRRDGRLASIEFTSCSLAVVEGADAGKQAPLERSSVRIGTSAECGLVLTDPTVSRVHCEISIEEKGFLLRDLGSTNGVTVGGLMVREVYLVPGSSFSIGSCRIELKASGERGEIRLSDQEKFGRVIGRSVKMREIFYLLERMSLRDVTILLTGETGTGKEVFAQSIHDASARKDGPFLTVDCGSLPENLIESELFGHAKGAFTGATADRAGVFEEASKGTVFLDEIGELPVAQQTKLLRVLESREIRRLGENASRPVDVRIIAATNRSLPDEVEAQRFRKDLYFRLSVCEIRIPALRERPDDVPLLAEHFMAMLAPPGRAKPPKLSADALGALAAHPWPGNVRELRNVIEKAIALQDADEIDAASIALGTIREGRPGAGGVIDASVPYDLAHDRFEREYLLDLLRRNDMNVTQAARSAGLHRQSIHRLLRKHGIKPSEYRE